MSDRTLLLLILLILVSPVAVFVLAVVASWIVTLCIAVGMGVHNAVRRAQGWGQ